MDMGYTIGGEWMFDLSEDFSLGLGGEYRSRVKSSDADYMLSVPVYVVGKYRFFDNMFYGVGRVGYNVTSEVQGGPTGGGHYVAAGLGKDVGVFNVEVLYTNMGYRYKDAGETGREDSVGIVFGVKLGDIYDKMTGKGGSSEEVTAMEEPGTVAEDETTDSNTSTVAPMAASAVVAGGATTDSEVVTGDDTSVDNTNLEYENYTIEKGDTLFGIGMSRNVTWDKISEKNDIEDPDVIYAEDEIEVPKK
jgi:LysM repeat protein